MAVNIYFPPTTNVKPLDLLNWLNLYLNSDYNRIEQLSTGAAFCKLMYKFYSNSITLEEVIFEPKSHFECVKNFPILQMALDSLKVDCKIALHKLSAGSYNDILHFTNWLKTFFDMNFEKSNATLQPGTSKCHSNTPNVHYSSSGIDSSLDDQMEEMYQQCEKLKLMVDDIFNQRDFYKRKYEEVEGICLQHRNTSSHCSVSKPKKKLIPHTSILPKRRNLGRSLANTQIQDLKSHLNSTVIKAANMI